MKFLASVFVISLLSLSPAAAKIYQCTFTEFKMLAHSQHKQKDIIASYLGEKFYLDTKKKILQRG